MILKIIFNHFLKNKCQFLSNDNMYSDFSLPHAAVTRMTRKTRKTKDNSSQAPEIGMPVI